MTTTFSKGAEPATNSVLEVFLVPGFPRKNPDMKMKIAIGSNKLLPNSKEFRPRRVMLNTIELYDRE